MKHIFFTIALAASSTWNCQATTVSKELQPNKLWYNKPAYAFEESLPLGNGKLGALVYGGANNDSIQLNDITLWTGVPVNPNEGGRATSGIPKSERRCSRRITRPPIPCNTMCKAITRSSISHWA